jgi:hypothetical protein
VIERRERPRHTCEPREPIRRCCGDGRPFDAGVNRQESRQSELHLKALSSRDKALLLPGPSIKDSFIEVHDRSV